MSDYNSSLPVKTQSNGDVAAFIADGTTPSQLLAVDSSGRITIKLQDGAGTSITSQANGAQRALDVGINVSGTQIDPRAIRALTSSDVITAAQGSAGVSAWLTTDAADGSVSGGTAASKSMLGGLIYNSAAPTLTTGQQASLQGDASGNLKTSLITALPAGSNSIGNIGTVTTVTTVSAVTAITNALPAGTNTIGNANIQASGTALTATGSSLNVNLTGGTIGVADKSAFTYGTTSFSNSGGVFQDTSPSLTAGQQGIVRLTANRAFHNNLRDSSGNELLGSKVSASSIPVVIASDQASIPVAATQSGTWTVQPGNTANTTPWLVTDSSDGTVAAGTAATKSSLAGLVFNSAAPSLTTGQQVAMQGDASGNLLVNLKTALPAGANTIGAVTQASGPWTQNLTQVGGSAIALGQTTMSASLPVTIASNQSALPVSQSGTWTVATNADGTVAAGTAASKSLLTGAVYNTSLPTLTNGQQAALQMDSSGRLLVDVGVSSVLTVNQGTSPWVENVSQFGGSAVVTGTGASGAGIPRVTVSNDSAVLANIQVAGSAVSASNPVPVSISSTIPGTPIQNYNTAASVAAGGTSNHVYTVTAAKTLNLSRIWASGSGKLKIEVQVETGVATGVYTTKFVGFNSTATPNIGITVVSALAVAAGVRVQIIRTNKDNQSQDVYTTIEGTEV